MCVIFLPHFSECCGTSSLNVLMSETVSGHSITEDNIFRMKEVIAFVMVKTFLDLEQVWNYMQTYIHRLLWFSPADVGGHSR